MRRRLFILAIAVAFAIPSRPAQAADRDVVAVLSSHSEPYRLALEGFEQAFGRAVPHFVLADGEPTISPETRIIIAIGGKAALHDYGAPNATFIYCLAPGTYVDPKSHTHGLTKVFASPAPQVLLQKLKGIQPTLTRLGAICINASVLPYGRILQEEGKKTGISVQVDRLASLEDLPDQLRAYKDRIDAIWLPPDPQLITQRSFAIMHRYSVENNIPLYVSVDALADQGATASISASFKEMGMKAGLIAADTLQNGPDSLASLYYADKVSVTLNVNAATMIKMSISSDIQKFADRTVP